MEVFTLIVVIQLLITAVANWVLRKKKKNPQTALVFFLIRVESKTQHSVA